MTISKCIGTDCPKKSTCKRFLIEPLVRYQPWMCMEVSIKLVSECRFYLGEALDTPNLIS